MLRKSLVNILRSRKTLGNSTVSLSPRSLSSVDDSSGFFNRPGPWDERDLGSLLDANKAWARKMNAEKPNFFEQMKKGHAPKILWIGCSDARVPANEIIGEPPGSVFVHRNIANQIVSTDFNCMSVIQYAVDVLKVKHIIVCGHYDCGGVKASLQSADFASPLCNWLRNLRDTYRLHRFELNDIEDPQSRQRRLVELNVVEQCINVIKTSAVQRSRLTTKKQKSVEGSNVTFKEPRIHGMVYEPTTGETKMLDIDFDKITREIGDIYSLYNQEGDLLGEKVA